jgi:hypothetical protein
VYGDLNRASSSHPSRDASLREPAEGHSQAYSRVKLTPAIVLGRIRVAQNSSINAATFVAWRKAIGAVLKGPDHRPGYLASLIDPCSRQFKR